MIISCPDGYEFELTWCGLVDHWHVRLHSVLNNPFLTNTPGVQLVAQMHTEPPKERISRHKQNPRCALDFPWQCPYGSAMPCISKRKSDNRELADLEYTYWERRQGIRQPEINKGHRGQMRFELFSDEEKGYWCNVDTGEERWTDEPRPYQHAITVCKPMAVASMEYHKRHFWGGDALKWRILPVDDDMDWVNNQQIKHSGRFDACVFDIWD